MYAIKLNGRKLQVNGESTFWTYESARAALRMKIRKMVRSKAFKKGDFGFFDNVSRNPSKVITKGFSIVRL